MRILHYKKIIILYRKGLSIRETEDYSKEAETLRNETVKLEAGNCE